MTKVGFCLPDGGIDFWAADMSPYIISSLKKENYGHFDYDFKFSRLEINSMLHRKMK